MSRATDTASLRHIIVVGGTGADWDAMSEHEWSDRLSEFGKVADHVGASWLTLRPVADGGGAERETAVGGCVVSAQPEADGRQRVAAAAAALQSAGEPITEAAIAERLNWPALADPDLVVVLGPSHRLPASLVWELAYAELVFLDTEWRHLGAAHLADAIANFAQRHRRFGGID